MYFLTGFLRRPPVRLPLLTLTFLLLASSLSRSRTEAVPALCTFSFTSPLTLASLNESDPRSSCTQATKHHCRLSQQIFQCQHFNSLDGDVPYLSQVLKATTQKLPQLLPPMCLNTSKCKSPIVSIPLSEWLVCTRYTVW